MAVLRYLRPMDGEAGKAGSVTIEDVARVSGVSRQTVSRVINRQPNVRPAVRDRVNEAIEQLGYVPSLSARRMASGRSYLILALNDRQRTLDNWREGRDNHWLEQMLYGGMTECEQAGYRLQFELIDCRREKTPRPIAGVVASLRPDGVILAPPHSDDTALAEWLEERSIPFARIGHRDGHGCVDVYMDEAAAARAATRHLLELGHRRIAYVAGAADGNWPRRAASFHAAAAAAGVTDEDLRVVSGADCFDLAAHMIDGLLGQRQRPSAIVADNEEIALATLRVADRRGLPVPEALSIISFEDTPRVRSSVPPLTAICQPIAAMVAKACERLIAIGNGSDGNGHFELPFELVRRDSTGSLRR